MSNMLAIRCAAVLSLLLSTEVNLARRQPQRGAATTTTGGDQTAGVMSLESQRALVNQYCATCHNDTTKAGGMSLAALDLAHIDQHAELVEKMIRKLRVGMMPPAGARRPETAVLQNFALSLETAADKAAATTVNPGARLSQRLTRTEYAHSVRELLGIDVDVDPYLPPDTLSGAFDNIADTQSFTPTQMDGYMRAAAKISREALGDPNALSVTVTYSMPTTASQMRDVEGAPFGTRGGMVVEHNFPANGEYVFNIELYGGGAPFGQYAEGEQIEVAINGERVGLVDVDPKKSAYKIGPIPIKAGPQRISAAFSETTTGIADDLLIPIEHTLAAASRYQQVTTLPHLQNLSIVGPQKVTGVAETAIRQRVFKCRPTSAAEEAPCAKQIISDLARHAYRRPVTGEDLEGLMSFYEKARAGGDFEVGIRSALQVILVNPAFLFRLERTPPNVGAGQNYRVGDLELASRLSYFLWTTPPDDELISVAASGKLSDPASLDKQVKRMLADPRAESLSTKFAAQWLRLGDLERIVPNFMLYPYFDTTLSQAMLRETELFFDTIVREDRNVFDLLTADDTFVNERLAKNYGIPNIVGSSFRRVKLSDENRRGILGQGSFLLETSVADRTSPVIRGKWVMEVLLGMPPPPPPPNVPLLTETKAVANGKVLSVRERMEIHRANPSCNSCHRMIDPIGLALENFDVTGDWRIKDGGALIDPSSTLYDGTKLNGPADLRKAVLNYSEAVIRNFTENLMMYGLGRRLDYRDMPLVRQIVRDASRQNYRFSSFISGIVKSPAFRLNRIDSTVNH